MHYSFEILHLTQKYDQLKVTLALITYWNRDKIERILIVLAHKTLILIYFFLEIITTPSVDCFEAVKANHTSIEHLYSFYSLSWKKIQGNFVLNNRFVINSKPKMQYVSGQIHTMKKMIQEPMCLWKQMYQD